MDKDLGVVFIHGAGLDGYIWENVAANLNYPSLMIDFLNRNDDHKANSKLRFEDYVDKAISDTDNFGKQKFVVVTHSIGGLIGLKIAERFKDKILGFVAIAAAIPENGNSFVSCLPFPQKLIVPIIMKLAGTKPPKAAIENGLCNDLNETHTQAIVQNFTAESEFLYTDRSKSVVPETKKLYVQLTNDKEFPIAVQKKMADNLECKNISVLESGHLPMLGVPEKLAVLLNEFIDECSEQDRQNLKSQS